MPICSVAELFGVTPANTHDVNDTGRVIVTVALLSAARLNVPHCLIAYCDDIKFCILRKCSFAV